MTAMWLLFLGLHLIGFTGYNLILRKASIDKADPWSLATIMSTALTIPMVLAIPFARLDLSVYADFRIFLLVIAAASLGVALHVSNTKALQYLEASVYSVLFNLRIIFTTVLGVIFLNEQIIPLQIAGGLLIFLAIVTVRQKGRKELTHRGLEWGIAASIVISFLNLSEKELINEIGFFGDAIPVFILTTIVMWAIMLGRKQNLPLKTFLQPQILWLMLFRIISAYGFMLAFFAGGELSVSSYISSLGVILIVVLGVVLLGEKDYLKQKIIATSMAALGLTFILIANLG